MLHWLVTEFFEVILKLFLERFVEDFEILDEIAPHHDTNSPISRFCLNRTPGKYMILEKPEVIWR